LTVSAAFKEGYKGALALSVEGLPQGVKAFVGANGSPIELVAEASAPATQLPRLLRITGLPLVEGNSGPVFAVAEIPLMVGKR
jgi:hypothetical protein